MSVQKDKTDKEVRANRMSNVSICFALSHNLRYGSGTQQVTLNYLKAIKKIREINPDYLKLKISVLDSDYTPGHVTVLTDRYVREIVDSFEYLSIHSFVSYFSFFGKNRYSRNMFYYILNPFLLKLTGRMIYKKILDRISGSDFVILIDNDMSFLFPKRKSAKLIATNHALFGGATEFYNVVKNPLSFWRLIDAFIFLSRDKEKIQKCDKPYFVLPNGVDVDKYLPLYKNNRLPKFIFFGRISREKGISLILEIWNKVEHKELAELHIAGDGPLKPLVSEYKAMNFYYHGKMPDEEIIKFIQSGDVLLYPSLKDNFPLVVLESLSCGVYCLISENLKDEFSDFVDQTFAEFINPLDTTKVAKRIDSIILHKDYENVSKEKLFEYVKRNYSWESITLKLFEGLENL